MRMRHLLLRKPAHPWPLLVKHSGMVIVYAEGGLICVSYRRVVLDALSTHLGYFCRIPTTINVVIYMTEMRNMPRTPVNTPDLREHHPCKGWQEYRQYLL